ncbi:DUF6893 family small protein [Kitasatospora nipponensis]
MRKVLILGTLAAVLGALARQTMPDLKRYLAIRRM